MVLEVDLNDLVRQPEHNGVLGSHPFLHVYRAGRVLQLIARVHLVDRYQSLLLLRVVVLL